MKFVENGSVTTPKGFRASGVACGLKKNGNKDLAIVESIINADCAGVFTKNVVKGHSLQLSMKNISDGQARAIVINSGNANACVGDRGLADAIRMTELVGRGLGCSASDILAGSTGVIGMPLDMNKVEKGIEQALAQLSENGGHDAEAAIMTTDLVAKEFAIQMEMDGVAVKLGGMAKGSGMIHPNMATMIGVITSDVDIDRNLLQKALKSVTEKTFNRVSVDGDTSVCDKVIIFANGLAGNKKICEENQSYKTFEAGLQLLCESLSRLIAKDGEGATKLIEITLSGAASAEDAYKIVCSVAKSPLFKTAMFGEDANWGRILTAAGYSGAEFDPNKADIYIGDVMTCKNGTALAFDEEKAKAVLKQNEVKVHIDLNMGNFSERMWTCDFSYDYVKINGSYRS